MHAMFMPCRETLPSRASLVAMNTRSGQRAVGPSAPTLTTIDTGRSSYRCPTVALRLSTTVSPCVTAMCTTRTSFGRSISNAEPLPPTPRAARRLKGSWPRPVLAQKQAP